jgi:probable H4MPT-linked C1 transfer pathway protein
LWDVGSTTTDIVPVDVDGPRPVGLTDPERLVSGELSYTGVVRTPVAALLEALPWRGSWCPVASELFATSVDAYILLGEIAEDDQACDTADGRGRTRAFARQRLARMICADQEVYSMADALAAAVTIRDAQISRMFFAARQVVSRLDRGITQVIASGQGEFLIPLCVKRLGVDVPVVSLREQLGTETSRVATGHALAVLAAETGLMSR